MKLARNWPLRRKGGGGEKKNRGEGTGYRKREVSVTKPNEFPRKGGGATGKNGDSLRCANGRGTSEITLGERGTSGGKRHVRRGGNKDPNEGFV